ncbi:MAG: hypothetical protein RL728_942 [Bacteroidota bacterium]|jgi:hypothetical protein
MQKRMQQSYFKAFEKAAREIANSSLENTDISDSNSSDNEGNEALAKVGKDTHSDAHPTLTPDAIPSSPIHWMASHKVVLTVGLVYKEWYDGWDGRPSISELNQKYGFRWRAKKDVKVYSRRSKIIREIQKMIAAGNTAESAISILETRRGKKAISTFADSLGNELIN